MTIASTWEHYYFAVTDLATAGPLRERLHDATMHHLLLVTPDDLPDPIAQRHTSLMDAVGAHRSVQTIIATMSDDDLAVIAKEVVAILHEIYQCPEFLSRHRKG